LWPIFIIICRVIRRKTRLKQPGIHSISSKIRLIKIPDQKAQIENTRASPEKYLILGKANKNTKIEDQIGGNQLNQEEKDHIAHLQVNLLYRNLDLDLDLDLDSM
jgi:hypothetical protein